MKDKTMPIKRKKQITNDKKIIVELKKQFKDLKDMLDKSIRYQNYTHISSYVTENSITMKFKGENCSVLEGDWGFYGPLNKELKQLEVGTKYIALLLPIESYLTFFPEEKD